MLEEVKNKKISEIEFLKSNDPPKHKLNVKKYGSNLKGNCTPHNILLYF